MSEKPFFSIIMGVYGAEKYLEACVDSILNQDFEDVELILVDDCSPDKSGEICDALAEKDGRIKVIHLPENGGANNARKVGLSHVTGKYISFWDSDDTVENGVFRRVYDEIEKNHPQICLFGVREKHFNKNNELFRTIDVTYPQKYLSDKQQVRKEVIEIEKSTLFGYLCDKFYSMELIEKTDIEFVDMKLFEDFKCSLQIIQNAESLSTLDFIGYNYWKRAEESLTSRFVADYFDLQKMRVSDLRESYISWGLYTDGVKNVLGDIYARSIVSALQRNCDKRSEMTHSDRKKWLDALFADELWQELSPYFTLDKSLQGILSRLLKTKSRLLCLMSGRAVYIVKQKLPMLFLMFSRKK